MRKRFFSFALVLELSVTLVPYMAQAVPTIGDSFTTISAGSSCSYAIKSDGSLWAWGGNHDGRLGDSTLDTRNPPIKIMDSVVSITAGVAVALDTPCTMAIRSDGSLWTWGGEYGSSRRPGSDSMSYTHHTPVKVMDSVVAVAGGMSHNAVLKTDGSLWTWGWNRYGQLGDGTTEDRRLPVKVMDSVVAIAAGSYHTMAIKDDGSLWVWGSNYSGSLGNGMREDEESHIPIKIMDSVVAVSTNGTTSMAIKKDGSLWAWGDNQYGQIGDGTANKYDDKYPIPNIIEDNNKYSPVKIMDSVVSVSAGSYHTAAIKSDGSLWVCGNNDHGQIGDGTASTLDALTVVVDRSKYSPVKIMDSVMAVSAGSFHTMAIKSDGSLWSWGSLTGTGTTDGSPVPVKTMDGVMLPKQTTTFIPSLPSLKCSPWAADELRQAEELGLIPNAFRDLDLTRPITRAEYAKIAIILFENLTSEKTLLPSASPFTDTNDHDILRAYRTGLMVGVASNKFAPDAILNREQAATALTRVLKCAYIPGWTFETDSNVKLIFKQIMSFSDENNISAWSKESVHFMASSGTIEGVGGNLFAPSALATREQAIVIGLRLVLNLKDKPLEYSQLAP